MELWRASTCCCYSRSLRRNRTPYIIPKHVAVFFSLPGVFLSVGSVAMDKPWTLTMETEVRYYDENTEYNIVGDAVNLWTEDGTMVNTGWLEQVYWRKCYLRPTQYTVLIATKASLRLERTPNISQFSLMHKAEEMKARWPCPGCIATRFVQV